MLRHLTSVPVSDFSYQSAIIKERNLYIRANKFSVVDGGFANFSDIYCIGENHTMAAEWLEARLSSATTTETAIGYEKECEYKFEVQVWASHEFEIR